MGIITAQAEASGTDGELNWTLSDNGVLTISPGSGTRGSDYTVEKSGIINIRYTYNSPYHAYKDNIKKVIFKNGVVQIGENAFNDCTSLTSVEFANTIDTIGYHAFANCTSLIGAALPANCTWYWAYIFEGCTGLQWAVLPTRSNNLKITTGTFKNCSSLKTVYVGAKHSGLDGEVFSGCTSLKTIVWANTDNINDIGSNALRNVPSDCKMVGAKLNGYTNIDYSGTCGDNLKYDFDLAERTIYISGNGTKVTSNPWNDYKEIIAGVNITNITSDRYDIGDGIFENSYCLSNIEFGNNLLRIGTATFKNCTNLKNVNLPDSMDTLGGYAFQNCESLENITLPNNCTWYWQYAFENCVSLKWAILPNYCNSFNGSIPTGLFKNCTSLESVFVGNNHNAIGEQTFYNCTSLKSLIWDTNNNITVNNEAMVNVPTDLKIVGANINGYDTITTNGKCGDNMSFSYNSDTMKISFTGYGDMWENPSWSAYINLISEVDFGGMSGNYNIVTSAFSNGKNIKSVSFGDKYLKNIGWGAFMNCSSIKHIVIPNTVENIWGCAFENCTGVDTVDFRAGGTQDLYIREYSFKNLNHSTWWLDIPANTVMIGTQAFYGSSFNYIKVFTKDFTIGDDAFYNYGNYARFMGVTGSPLKEFVSLGQSKGYDWFYNCVGEHDYQLSIVNSNCIKLGYHQYSCKYCDDSYKVDYREVSAHNYKKTGQNGSIFTYSCDVCGSDSLQYDAKELLKDFSKHLSTSNYLTPATGMLSCCDVNGDGYANAKDFMLLSTLAISENYANRKTIIDTNTTYQTIEGFGASACWWSQTAGQWDNIDEIMELLYGKDKGIGLNIYRYNLGAGSKFTEADKTDNSKTYCFLNADGTYNWNADEGAMKALASAQKINPDLKLTLFCNSAPVYMTDNGLAHTTTGKSKNLSENRFQDFANFVTTCTEHFIDEGYNVTNVSPINEPEFTWDGSNQEGCHWEPSHARKFYNDYMIPSLKSNSKLNGVELSVWESGSMASDDYWNSFMYNFFSDKNTANNSNIRSYVDSVDTHSYWAGDTQRQAVANQLKTSEYNVVKKVRCTEYCQMTTDGNSGVYGITLRDGTTNGTTMEFGLALADIMHQDLTVVNAVEWDWWTGASGGIYPDGLVYLNWNNPTKVDTSKRLWCMGNYSKFIDVGAKRIKVSTGSAFGNNTKVGIKRTWNNGANEDKNSYVEESAYLNPDGSVVVVYINNSDTVEHTNFDTSQFKTFKTYVTDQYNDLELMQNTTTNDYALIPANSVTTVILK